MDQIKDIISLEIITRIILDIQKDSCIIVYYTVSQFQKYLINIIFIGGYPNLNKENIIITNKIATHMTSEEYMDKGE